MGGRKQARKEESGARDIAPRVRSRKENKPFRAVQPFDLRVQATTYRTAILEIDQERKTIAVLCTRGKFVDRSDHIAPHLAVARRVLRYKNKGKF